MRLTLEIKHPDGSISQKTDLSEGVYVLTRRESSDLGKAITVNSDFMRPDHAVLQWTRAGWTITAHQPLVRRVGRNGGLLPVHETHKFGANSQFTVGPLEFRFVQPLADAQAEADASEDALASLDRRISEVHFEVSRLAQHQIRNIQANPQDPEYRARVSRIIVERVNAALAECDGRELRHLAADAGRRDMIYRLLGGAGILEEDRALDIADMDCREFAKVQKDISQNLGLHHTAAKSNLDIACVNTSYADAFLVAAKSIRSALLGKVIRKFMVQSVLDVMFGIGPLEFLRKTDDISEIMVVRYDKIFVELNGKLVETGLSFVSEDASKTITSSIIGRVGKQLNVQNPYEDARLADGSRVNAVSTPIALDGTALTIRKFGKNALTREQLIRFGAISRAMASFLEGCVVSKKNIVVSGGTGTGKTTMVNWLATLIPPAERIVTVEDTAELRLGLPHVVRLEARPPSSDGHGEVSIRDLVKNALRMRPDRIVIGECRGGEAFDMLQAMNTGHEGSMTTLHANNATEAMSRIENLVLMADQGLPIDAIRYQIAGAVDYVVQLTRYPDGARKTSAISEIGGIDPVTGRIEVNPVFETHYDPSKPEAGTAFSFSGRTPEAIAEIIKGGFDPSFLSFQ
jgi:Flp pilus assembly CpaF family ATPase